MKVNAVFMHVVSAGTLHRDCWSPYSNASLRYWVGAPRDRGEATKHAAVSQGTTLNAGFFKLVSIPRGSVLRIFRVRLRLDPPGVQNRLVHTCRSAWKLEGGMINPMCLMHVL